MAQATAAPGSAHSAVAKENKKAIQARNLRTGLLFTAPALIVLAIFVFYPAIKTFITSLTSDRINRAGKFVRPGRPSSASTTTSSCSKAPTSGPTSRTPSSTQWPTLRSS